MIRLSFLCSTLHLKKKKSQQEMAFHLLSTNITGFKSECILGQSVFLFYLENLHIFMHAPFLKVRGFARS